MYRVRFSKTVVGPSSTPLRTQEIVGSCLKLPKVGEPFEATAPPLSYGTVRLISTTPVVGIAVGGPDGADLTFRTASESVYSLWILGQTDAQLPKV